MNRIFILFVLIFIGAIVISGAASAAGLVDSDQPKFQHDNQNTGQSQYNGPATNTTKWNITGIGGDRTSPVIGSDGTIYVADGNYGNLYSINPNGTINWVYSIDGSTGYTFIESTPAIGSDGTIYFGSGNTIGQTGNIYAINPDGTLKWFYPTGNQIWSSPAIGSDGTIYIGSNDGKFYAINPNGTLKWDYMTSEGYYDNRISSSPAIGSDGTIYVGCDNNNLYAFNPDGSLKWIYTAAKSIPLAPVIGADGTIYFGCYDDCLYAINPDGTQKWKYFVGSDPTYDNVYSSPAVSSDGTIYIISGEYTGIWDNYLKAINPDGTFKWSYFMEKAAAVSMTIGLDGTIYIGGDYGNYICAINSNGTLKWKNYCSWVESAPAISSDGTLYVLGINGFFAIADITVTAQPAGGSYNTKQDVKFSTNVPGTIYWRFSNLLHPNPIKIWQKYNKPIIINNTSTLQFYAVDLNGNQSPIYTETYVIDKQPPKIVNTDPSNNANNVSLDKVIIITFDEPIKAGSAYDDIKLKVDQKSNIRRLDLAINTIIRGNKLYIELTNGLLKQGCKYTLNIPSNAISDLSGNLLKKSTTITFKTVKYII
ncbi:MAG: PQQ-binding-like beta-propeller repeat protein [Methanobacterium sp.]|nr:PQQ-binding-like beta-propeller repeat protein [Methanobacterium sp.]